MGRNDGMKAERKGRREQRDCGVLMSCRCETEISAADTCSHRQPAVTPTPLNHSRGRSAASAGQVGPLIIFFSPFTTGKAGQSPYQPPLSQRFGERQRDESSPVLFVFVRAHPSRPFSYVVDM